MFWGPSTSKKSGLDNSKGSKAHHKVISRLFQTQSLKQIQCSQTNASLMQRLDLPPEVKTTWWLLKYKSVQEENSFNMNCWTRREATTANCTLPKTKLSKEISDLMKKAQSAVYCCVDGKKVKRHDWTVIFGAGLLLLNFCQRTRVPGGSTVKIDGQKYLLVGTCVHFASHGERIILQAAEESLVSSSSPSNSNKIILFDSQSSTTSLSDPSLWSTPQNAPTDCKVPANWEVIMSQIDSLLPQPPCRPQRRAKGKKIDRLTYKVEASSSVADPTKSSSKHAASGLKDSHDRDPSASGPNNKRKVKPSTSGQKDSDDHDPSASGSNERRNSKRKNPPGPRILNKHDKSGPKKPRNAYILFCTDSRSGILAQNPTRKFTCLLPPPSVLSSPPPSENVLLVILFFRVRQQLFDFTIVPKV